MRIFRHVEDLAPDRFRNPVVTIGVFDGVHRGHHALLEQARAMADRLGGELVVLTFHQHPRTITVGRAPATVTSLDHRILLLEREGVDTTIVLFFDEHLREMPAETFVEDVLVGRIGAHGAVLGYDSHFGHNREGDAELLRRLLGPRGIPVERVGPVTMPDGEVVSSTTIREAVARGDLTRAADLLGRPAALHGVVVRGDGRGRTLGFPTANLDLHGELRPIRGVYGAKVEIDGTVHGAAVNIGGRPTFYPEGEGADTVEVHVLDLDAPLYGRHLEVVLLGAIRPERRFDSVEALKAQIDDDVATVRARIADGTWPLD